MIWKSFTIQKLTFREIVALRRKFVKILNIDVVNGLVMEPHALVILKNSCFVRKVVIYANKNIWSRIIHSHRHDYYSIWFNLNAAFFISEKKT
jgi:hypothetical protein